MTKFNEHYHQVEVIGWKERNLHRWPFLWLLHSTPNGGARPAIVKQRKRDGKMVRFSREAGKLKAEGLVAGIPDLFLPVPNGLYPGLWIEMKAEDGEVSPEQKRAIAELQLHGYKAVVCYGYRQAIEELTKYCEKRDEWMGRK